ncbi:MAG: hypothetical protein B5M48_03955 [Candidatus Omnitrophica bacterium 4484_213]|nr:MAG: hypothetical protein B5M48_03955 [Candidatus Omnitrophica bacterium 4484_213]
MDRPTYPRGRDTVVFSTPGWRCFYYFFKRDKAINFSCRFRHFFNRDIKEPNAGIDVHAFLIGVSTFFSDCLAPLGNLKKSLQSLFLIVAIVFL